MTTTVIADAIVLRIQLRGEQRGPRTDAEETEIVTETDAAATADVVVTAISAGSILRIRMFQRLLYDSLF